MDTDKAFARLFGAIRSASAEPKRDNMIFGTVVSPSPLKVKIYDNVVLGEESLFLGQMCRPHKVTIPHTHQINVDTEMSGATGNAIAPTEKGDLNITFAGQGTLTVIEPTGHKHKIQQKDTEDVHKTGTAGYPSIEIEIYPKLKSGDRVLMFAFNDFQMFYVAERLETA